MLRKLPILALAVVSLVLAGSAGAAKPDRNTTVTVMTQNMDDGTDLTYVIGAFLGLIPLTPEEAVDLTALELEASAFQLRATLMAADIAARRPEFVALQEAVLWRTGPTPDAATTVLYDNIGYLLSALKSLGLPYDVVAVNHLADLALPGVQVPALRFTDRNALLMRSDLRPPAFHLSNVHARTFDAKFPFTVAPGVTLTVPAGWISADVHMGNKQFRLVTTHLQTPIAGIDEATAVQVAQADELIHALRNLTIPVVICGDFNSDANHGGFIDTTDTVGNLEAAGYEEVWPKANGAVLGFTWPVYLEDQAPPNFFVTSAPGLPPFPFERIDLFFSKGLDVESAGVVIRSTDHPELPIPPYASDHAGVVAVFRFE